MKKKRNKLVLMISLVLVVGFAATSLASYFVSLAALRKQIAGQELPLTSDNIYSEIQRDLLSPIFISSLMAGDTFLRDWIIGGEKESQQVIRYLKQIQEEYGTFTSFFVSEKTRTYYHSGGILKTVQQDEPRDAWYFRVRQMASDYEINVDPDMANLDSMTIFINYKVYDYNNRFIGATGVGLTVSAVIKLIREYQDSFNRRVCFVDKQGRITLQSFEADKAPGRIQEMEGLSAIFPQILSGKQGHFRYKRNQELVHLNTRYIPEFDWYLLVEQTETSAIRTIRQALWVNLGVCALITGVVLLLISLTISAYQRRLEKMAGTDKLTGLYNRQAFDIVMGQALKDVRRKKLELSILLFDIDYFKKVNDRFGHLAGDAAIRHIVEISQGIIRESDIFCRWGGEEFLILLKGCDLDDAYRIAEKVRLAVQDNPARHDGRTISATISCGVARYRKGEDEDTLLSRADRCLYMAKHNGRNRSEKGMPKPA